MNRFDHRLSRNGTQMFCDVTQSWSDVGGGVRTYLLHKRRHILETTPHSHLLIVPGNRDEVVEEDRAVTVTIRSPPVPGSPHYRLMLRNRAVSAALDHFRPDLIECQDAYNLPWAAIRHRKRFPETALVAAYMTDFPTVYLERPLSRFITPWGGGLLARAGYAYASRLYRHFDAIFALSENGGASKLRSLGVDRVDVVPLGVELGEFGNSQRDEGLRRKIGVQPHEPLLIYVGRLDGEKKPDLVVEAFRRLPEGLGARLVLIGEGPLKAEIAALQDDRIVMPGYMKSRSELARWLASSDLYVSGMADETFGISIVEAQASGLPVIGVAAGAMIDRVPDDVGRLGPVGDAAVMVDNILSVWNADRTAMAQRARAEALRFSWDNSMDALFNRLYPSAFERRARLAAAQHVPIAAGAAAL